MYFILGAPDPEMHRIEHLLTVAGVSFGYASVAGQRVHPGNMYKADGVLSVTGEPVDVVALGHNIHMVECAFEDNDIDVAMYFDHHRAGDRGFGKDPYLYWEASSIGQVYNYLVNRHGPVGMVDLPNKLGAARLADYRYAAAADHCLAHAYRGKCPGVDPAGLGFWRIMNRAEFQKKSPSELLDLINEACVRIGSLPTVRVGGSEFKDARECEIPELPEAGARLGVPVLYRLHDKRSGRIKVGVLNGDVGEIKDFIDNAAEELGLVDIYGDPSRGYAGGYEE